MLRLCLVLSTVLILSSCSKQTPVPPLATPSEVESQSESYVVMFGGIEVGEMTVDTIDNQLIIDFGFDNNGRGASSQETLIVDKSGIPIDWSISGKTTFGNAVDESFQLANGTAAWRAAAGEGSTSIDNAAIYIAQNASPYAVFTYANAMLMNQTMTMPALPAGTLTLRQITPIVLSGKDGEITASIYSITGIDLDPSYLVLDEQQEFVASISPRAAIVRRGYETEDERLRSTAAELNAKRFEEIANKVTHEFDAPVQIKNIRVFEPQSLKLSAPQTITVTGNRITNIEDYVESTDMQLDGVTVIDGEGGTLVAGLYEMHGHMSDNDALLNVLAGVTSVRDMGNEIDVLESLVNKIESGQLIGPRISRSGFIEGKSQFSAATGEMAETQEQALELIRDYASRDGYGQIKIYSSVNGDWVPAMAEEAHKLGLRVAGHVPAFFTADQMIEAGYDELTHINQVMLGWVLAPDEDTRTLFRITGMRRFADLDLNSEKVQKTLDLMVDNNIAVDPTTVIHEFGLTARNGEIRAGVRDYVENMPIGVQRNAKLALLNVSDEQEDAEYKAAFEKIIDMLSMMHKRGIFLVPGTDLGGAFELHRELELFQRFGMTPAEILKRGSYDMANYLGYGEDLGSIEIGKLADFFLVPGDPTADIKAIKTISLVSKDGKFFFPSEVYPEFGITPFTSVPNMH